MPINIGLVLALKRSVRSKELITLLNNLGHSVGYNDILRIDTTWAAAILKLMMGIPQYQSTLEKTFLLKPPLIMEVTIKKTTLNV